VDDTCAGKAVVLRLATLVFIGLLIPIGAGLVSCNNRAKLEACQILEIEDAEIEVDVGDVDVERGEVEMACGDKIIDVSWNEFQQQLRINPGQYKQNLQAFRQQVNCMKDERSSNAQVLCQGAGSRSKFVGLNFSYDD
jgi:hypothetical protein